MNNYRLLVALANLYDVLIDCPNAPKYIKNLLAIFEEKKWSMKEFIQSCTAHVATVENQLGEEYNH